MMSKRIAEVTNHGHVRNNKTLKSQKMKANHELSQGNEAYLQAMQTKYLQDANLNQFMKTGSKQNPSALAEYRKKTISVEPPDLTKLEQRRKAPQFAQKKTSQVRESAQKKPKPKMLDDLILIN